MADAFSLLMSPLNLLQIKRKYLDKYEWNKDINVMISLN